jgi:hypothetical protein
MRPSALQIVERLQAVPKLSGPTAVAAAATTTTVIAEDPQEGRTSEHASPPQLQDSVEDTVRVVPYQ